MSQRFRSTSISLIFVFHVLTCLAGCESKQATPSTATWDYWQSLRTIARKMKSFEKQSKAAETPAQIVHALRQGATTCRGMAGQINALPVLNVDEEVVKFASDSTALLHRAASIFTDLANFIDESQQFAEHYASFGAGLEAFVRGFLGDPLGTYNDARAQGEQFEQRRLTIMNRSQTLEEQFNQMDANEITLRATLARRHNREFPKLED